MKNYFYSVFFLCLLVSNTFAVSPAGIVVLQTDFGVKDSAVSEIKGVMYSVDKSLVVAEVTEEIPPYNIWDAAYRLYQAAPYWPVGSVFVSVVDPGVGTVRKSIVALTKDGRYFVTPDNGTLTYIADNIGIQEIREIDEAKNRLPGSSASYTFFGRDVYGYTAAKLASGKISFAEVGPKLTTPLVKFNYQHAEIKQHILCGNLVVLDPNYGNVWTNIGRELADQWGMKGGQKYRVRIYYKNVKKYDGMIAYENTFGNVPKGGALLYFNSLLNVAFALNQGNFAQVNKLGSGEGWRVEIG